MDDPTQPAAENIPPKYSTEATAQPKYIRDPEADAYERWLNRCMP